MATKTLVPVEEYLRMSFDGAEPEYLDGEIVERHLPSIPHFKGQKRMLEFFGSLQQSCSLFAYPEVTLRLSPKRYRIADVVAFVGGVPAGKYPTEPPAVVVEIVSEDDRYVEIQEKLAEYHAWGIKHVWLADPWTRRLSVYDSSGFHEVAAFELPEFDARITPAEVFADQTPQQ